MYTDRTLRVINDNDAFTDLSGVKHPSNYPKNEIVGIYPVTLTEQPTGDVVITGFHIDETHTQVWDYREKTTEELSEEKRQSLLNDIVALEAQAQKPRTVRGATLGKASDIAILQDLENQIEVKRNELRAQL